MMCNNRLDFLWESPSSHALFPLSLRNSCSGVSANHTRVGGEGRRWSLGCALWLTTFFLEISLTPTEGETHQPLFLTWKAPFLTLSWPSWGAEVTPAAMLSPTWHWESSPCHMQESRASVSLGLRAAGGVAGVNLPLPPPQDAPPHLLLMACPLP